MKPKFSILAATFSVCLALSHSAHALDLRWDIDPLTAAAQDGDGTWTAASTSFWNGTINATPVKGVDGVTFGASTTEPATPFTVTIDNGGVMLNYSDNTTGTAVNAASTLTINRSYNFTAAAPGDGVSLGNMSVNNGATVNFSAKIDGGHWTTALSPIGAKNWNVTGGSTLNLSGGGRIQSISNGSVIASTVNLTGGLWIPGSFNADGTEANNANIGGGGSEARVLTINHSAEATINSTFGNFNIGGQQGSNANTLTTYNLNGASLVGIGTKNLGLSMGGGALNTAGAGAKAILNVNGNAVIDTVNEVRVGNDGSGGTLNLNSGTVTTTAKLVICRRGNLGGPIVGALNVLGGTLNVAQIQFGDTQPALTPVVDPPLNSFVAGSSATFNLSGGTVYFNNATGLQITGTNPNLTTAINLSGGTLAATASWTTALPMTLSNVAGGVTFKAADSADAAKNITLNGVLSGSGSLTKTGAGIVTLGALNTYTGNTTVSAGTLAMASPGLGDKSTVTVATGATLNLTHTSNDIVSALVLGPNTMLPGVYDSTTSPGFITGSGKIEVVPPSGPFDLWVADPANGLAPGSSRAADADPDGDGIKNILEFILGGNPSIPSATILPQLQVTTNNYVFTFTRRTDYAASAATTFQWGSTLTGWAHTVNIGASSSGPDADGVTIAVNPTLGQPDTIIVTVPRAKEIGGKLFGRLVVTTL